MSRTLPLALGLALLASPAVADDAVDSRAHLHVGPFIGGVDGRIDLETTSPLSPFALFFGFDGTPSLVGALPPIGVNLGTASIFLGVTDGAGDFQLPFPTTAGQFGPPGTGVAIFFHALVINAQGDKIASDVKATAIEPLPVFPGFIAADPSKLPVGSDSLGGSTVEAADIDRDGDTDLIIAREFDVLIYMNDGTGTFVDETAARIAYTGDAVGAINVGDIDEDGDNDLLVGGGYDDFTSIPDTLWRNDGTGVFTQDASFPAGKGLTAMIELADVDNDGDQDVILATGPEGHLAVSGGFDQLYFNLGGGVFFPSTDFENGLWNDDLTPTTEIRAGDVDDDGDLDLFIVKSDTVGVDGTPGQPNVLLFNDGSGEFTDVTATNILPGAVSDNSEGAALFDIDGDFDLDIVVANSVLNITPLDSNDVLINQGGLQGGTPGVFLDDPASFLEATLPGDGIRLTVNPGDIDADGDIDVLVTTHDLFSGADQMLFLNDGGAQGGTEGTMVRQAWFDPPFAGPFSSVGDAIVFGAALFDADNDGDLEVLILNSGVVLSDPTGQFTAHYLVNSAL